MARFRAPPAGWYKIARLIPSVLLVYGTVEGILPSGPRMWQSCRVNVLHANERPVRPVSCRIPQLWTARPSVPSVSVRHGWLPMSGGMRKHGPLHRDHPSISGMGTTWCRPGPVVPAGYLPLSALLVVSVCDLSLPPRMVSVCARTCLAIASLRIPRLLLLSVPALMSRSTRRPPDRSECRDCFCNVTLSSLSESNSKVVNASASP